MRTGPKTEKAPSSLGGWTRGFDDTITKGIEMKDSTLTLAGQPGEIKLTDDESRLLASYRGMGPYGQQLLVDVAAEWKDRLPRRDVRSLCLVAGGAA